MNRINEKIGVWLLGEGNTKTRLADELGITTTTLNQKISGDTDWYWRQVIKIAEIVGCTIGDLADDTH